MCRIALLSDDERADRILGVDQVLADALLAGVEREGALAASDVSGSLTVKGMWMDIRQARTRLASLGRLGRLDPSPGQLRARVRPARARAARGDPPSTDTGRRSCVTGSAHARRQGARRGDSARPARLLPDCAS